MRNVPSTCLKQHTLTIPVPLTCQSRSTSSSRSLTRHQRNQCLDRGPAEGSAHVKLIIATTVATTLALAPLMAADNEPAKRLNAAAAVFSEIMAAPDKGIPQDLI